jgi:hypothetical protein
VRVAVAAIGAPACGSDARGRPDAPAFAAQVVRRRATAHVSRGGRHAGSVNDPEGRVDLDVDDVGEDRIEFDHVMVAVPDPQRLCSHLADEWGLHVHPDSLDFTDGISNLIVPLEPPQYLEILYVRDEEAFAGTDDVALVETFRRGGGLAGVVLRTSNITAVGEALGQAQSAGASVAGEGSPPWRLVSKPAEPHYPHYIQYLSPSAHERLQRWRQRFTEVAHRQQPGGIVRIEVSGSVHDLTAWLAPAQHLDIRVVEGPPHIAVAVRVGDQVMLFSNESAHPTVSA